MSFAKISNVLILADFCEVGSSCNGSNLSGVNRAASRGRTPNIGPNVLVTEFIRQLLPDIGKGSSFFGCADANDQCIRCRSYGSSAKCDDPREHPAPPSR